MPQARATAQQSHHQMQTTLRLSIAKRASLPCIYYATRTHSQIGQVRAEQHNRSFSASTLRLHMNVNHSQTCAALRSRHIFRLLSLPYHEIPARHCNAAGGQGAEEGRL